MKKSNIQIRNYAKTNGVFLWQIADAYGISPETLNKRLRHELSDLEKEEIIGIIDELSKQKGE